VQIAGGTVEWKETMSSTVTMAWEISDRMARAVTKVRERLLRVTAVRNLHVTGGYPTRRSQAEQRHPGRRNASTSQTMDQSPSVKTVSPS
jgi:hypothetical protein